MTVFQSDVVIDVGLEDFPVVVFGAESWLRCSPDYTSARSKEYGVKKLQKACTIQHNDKMAIKNDKMNIPTNSEESEARAILVVITKETYNVTNINDSMITELRSIWNFGMSRRMEWTTQDWLR